MPFKGSMGATQDGGTCLHDNREVERAASPGVPERAASGVLRAESYARAGADATFVAGRRGGSKQWRCHVHQLRIHFQHGTSEWVTTFIASRCKAAAAPPTLAADCTSLL